MGAFVNSRRKLGNDVTRSVNRDLFIRYTLLPFENLPKP